MTVCLSGFVQAYIWVSQWFSLSSSEAQIVFELILLIKLVLSATITLTCLYKVSDSAADCHGT